MPSSSRNILEMLNFEPKGLGGGKDTKSFVTVFKVIKRTRIIALHYLSVSKLSSLSTVFPPAAILVCFPVAAV